MTPMTCTGSEEVAYLQGHPKGPGPETSKKPWNSECHAKQIKTDQNIMTHHESWLTAVTRNFHKSDLIQNLTDQFIPGDLAASHLSGEAGLQRPCAGKLSTDVSSVSTSWAKFETNSMEFMP